MPSYRLEPKQIFNKDKCEKLLKSIMDPALEEFEYTSAEAESLAPHLSDTILSQVKRLNFDRSVCGNKAICDYMRIRSWHIQSWSEVIAWKQQF